MADRRLKMAQDELKVIEYRASLSANDAEMNEKLAEARTKVKEVDAEHYETTRRLISARQSAVNEVKNETAALKENTEAKENNNEQDEWAIEQEKMKVKLLEEQTAVRKRLIEEQWSEEDMEYQRLQERYEREMQLFLDDEEMQTALTEEYESKREEISEKYRQKEAEAKRQANEEEIAATQEKYDKIQNVSLQAAAATVSILNSLADAQDTSSKKGFESQKKMKIASATIEMLVGIVSAMSNAIRDLGFPIGPIVGAVQAAAIGVAGGVNIAKIKQQKFNGGSSTVSPTLPSTQSASASVSAIRDMTASVPQVAQVTGASVSQQASSKVYVTETDIAATTNKVQTIEAAARY